MKLEIEVLHGGTFHKLGCQCQDAHVRIWRRDPRALYVDVEETSSARADTWPAIGPIAVSEVELLMR